MHLECGDRVRHRRWGTGVVQSKLASRAVRVVFDETPHLPRMLKYSDLQLESVLEAEAQAEAEAEAEREREADAERERLYALHTGTEASLAPEAGDPSASFAQPAGGTVASPALPAPVRTDFATTLAKDEAWQTLEALRLGVVPSHGVRDYTVAREGELVNIAGLLEQERGCRVLWGDYGAGKTHLLEAAEQLALEHGFATARITLDPRENALHHPLHLYRRITDSVRTASQVGSGFEALFEELADSPDHYRAEGARASRFFSPYLHALRNGTPEDVGWLRDYVRGDNIASEEVNRVLARIGWTGERVLRMSDYRTYGRMYVHLVGTLACWCADAGAHGLVLLFDEVERVDALKSADQHYAFEVLKHYAAVTMERGDLGFEPDALYKGGHEVHRSIPLRFRDHQPLTSVFALTPLEEIVEEFASVTPSKSYDLHLAPLESGLLGQLVDRIATVYERAYAGYAVPDAARGDAIRRIAEAFDGGHDSFRDAVRATVFLLDAARFRGAEPDTR